MQDDSRSDRPAGGRRQRRPKAPITIDLPVQPPRKPQPPTEEPGPVAPASADQPRADQPDAVSEPVVEPETERENEQLSFDEPPEPFAARSTEREPMGVGEPSPKSSSEPPRAASPKAPERPGGFGMVAAGIVGGLVALVIGLLFSITGLLPSASRDAADRAASAASAASTAVATLDRRVAQLEAATTAGDVKDLAGKVASIDAAVKQVGSRVDALAKAPAPAAGEPAGTSGALAALAARVDRLESAPPPTAGQPALPSDLPNRVAAVEAELKGLSGKVADLAARPAGTATESERAARAVAIGTLRQAAEKGGPFAGDIAMLQVLGSDPADVAALKPLAEKGAPSRADLTARFPAVADAILAASNAPGPDAGFFDRVVGFARGLITVRPTQPIPGETPEAIVSRMQAAIDGGDVKTALAERDHLPGIGQDASSAWAAAAEARVAIDGLVAKLTQSLAPPGGG